MKRLSALVLGTLALAACHDPSAPAAPKEGLVVQPSARTVVPGQYIVVLKQGAGSAKGISAAVVAEDGSPTAQVLYTYENTIHGFAAKLSSAEVTRLQNDPRVAYVEPDQIASINTTQSGATWGIDRIDQTNLPLNGTYNYTSTGTGVRAYIIDTGIQTSHPQFGSRASAVYDAVGDGQNGQDCNGHGTHVAGTVGSSTYGVAKNVYLRAVRVLDCSGSGTNSGVIAGVNWVAANHIAPAVANMSLGGGASQAVDDAVNALANSGVFLAVAAGNENQDACNTSPARAANTTTVAASTSSDARASYSNYGGCVDLYAPGSNITSTWLNGGTNTISGTSMATPHVVGVAALYKATYGDASFSTIRTWLKSNASSGVISGNITGTNNLLLNKRAL